LLFLSLGRMRRMWLLDCRAVLTLIPLAEVFIRGISDQCRLGSLHEEMSDHLCC
jgi:hypothetical protein